jgi:ethylmalonyl-CoA/methylmalonyl-CoA decarboxylase
MSTAYARRIMRFGAGAVSLTKRNPRCAVLELQHPTKKNALSGKMMAELESHVSELEKDEEIAVLIVRGQGDFFCSGADLSVASGDMATPQQGADMCAFMQDVTTRLHRLPQISVAIIQGGAFGGGTELSTACDLRVFVQGAKWRCVHATMGLSPGWGGGARLVNLVGRTRALRLLCGAETVSTEQALAMGLADLVVPSMNEVDDKVKELVQPYMDLPITAVRACKSVVAAGADLPLQEALAKELQVFSQVWGAPANVDAVRKVLARIHHSSNQDGGAAGRKKD